MDARRTIARLLANLFPLDFRRVVAGGRRIPGGDGNRGAWVGWAIGVKTGVNGGGHRNGPKPMKLQAA